MDKNKQNNDNFHPLAIQMGEVLFETPGKAFEYFNKQKEEGVADMRERYIHLLEEKKGKIESALLEAFKILNSEDINTKKRLSQIVKPLIELQVIKTRNADERTYFEAVNFPVKTIDDNDYRLLADSLNQIYEKIDDNEAKTRSVKESKEKLEAIERISEAIQDINKTNRLVSQGNNVGLFEIMDFFKRNGLIRITKKGDKTEYHAIGTNKEVDKLVQIANEKYQQISDSINASRNREKKYKEIIRSKNGFEGSIRRGKFDVKFAYQIIVSTIGGSDIYAIDIENVMSKYPNQEKLIPIKTGDTFMYGANETPPSVNAAAKKLIEVQGKKQDENVGTEVDEANKAEAVVGL